jgi:bifunctional non-homologous end joining protein LigD
MLPQLMPMLAVAAEPFDSPDYSFEIKYDGVRALAAVEGTGWRLWGRERVDYTARYRELDVLRRLPAGTLVDGEVVAFDDDGRPVCGDCCADIS